MVVSPGFQVSYGSGFGHRAIPVSGGCALDRDIAGAVPETAATSEKSGN